MSKAALDESAAFECMMQAHQLGMGLVGTYMFERAEFFLTQLRVRSCAPRRRRLLEPSAKKRDPPPQATA